MSDSGGFSEEQLEDLFDGYDDVKEIEIEKKVKEVPKEAMASGEGQPEQNPERRRGVRRNVEGSIQTSNITWNYEYDDTKYKVRRIIKRVLIVVSILVIAFLGVFVAYPKAKQWLHEEEKHRTDITSSLTLSEEELSEKYDLEFGKPIIYAKRIPIYTDEIVNETISGGISVISIGGKQIGICIDNEEYEVYGIKDGEGAEYVIKSMRYDYTDVYKVETGLASGVREVNYYYNKNTKDCLAVLTASENYQIQEIAYFYDYNDVLAKAK